MATNYVPDVDPTKKQDVSARNLATIWEKSLANPLTFSEAVRQFDKVSKFGWKVIDGICQGTCPTADVLAPDLYRAIKDVEKLRDGFEVLTDRGAGSASWDASDQRYQRAKTIGLRVFYEAEKTINRVRTGRDAIKDYDPRHAMKETKNEWSFWKGALMVTLGIVAISTFSDLVKTVKD